MIEAGPATMKRKLLLLGATGLTGQQLLAQSIEKGHDITAMPQAQRVNLTLTLVTNPAFDDARGEHVSLQQEFVVLLQIAEGFLPRFLVQKVDRRTSVGATVANSL